MGQLQGTQRTPPLPQQQGSSKAGTDTSGGGGCPQRLWSPGRDAMGLAGEIVDELELEARKK